MKLSTKYAVSWSAIAVALSLNLAGAPAAGQGLDDKLPHFIYVENGQAPNAIVGFKRDSEGRLTELPGSPYPTGGNAIIDPTLGTGPATAPSFPDNDQIITVDHEHQLLFAANSDSNSIAVFHINPIDGSLHPVFGSPFSSGGTSPVSLGVRGDQIVIINQALDPNPNNANDQPSIVSRHITPDGQIVQLARDTTKLLPIGNAPTQALMAGDRPFIFNINRLTGSLDSWQLSRNGELRANAEQPLPYSEFPAGSLHRGVGLWTNPTSRELYVGFSAINRVGAYTWDELGNPVFQKTVPNSGILVCWFRSNREGTRLYASDSGNTSVPAEISVYDTTDPSNPVEIQVVPASGIGQLFHVEVDPTGQFLYALSERADGNVPEGQGNALHVFSIDQKDGTVSELPTSPFNFNTPPDVRPQGIAVF